MDKKDSIFYVDKSDTSEFGHDWKIYPSDKKDCVAMKDSHDRLQDYPAAPQEMVGRRMVWHLTNGNEKVNDLLWLASRYNAVNGDDFAVVAPYGNGTPMECPTVALYVKPEGTGSLDFHDKLNMLFFAIQGDGKGLNQDMVDFLCENGPDCDEKEIFRWNPSPDTVKAYLDATLGVEKKSKEPARQTVEDVYANAGIEEFGRFVGHFRVPKERKLPSVADNMPSGPEDGFEFD